MRVLISIDNYFAHYYIRLGFGKALTACGHEVVLWDINKNSAFDAFDDNKPDIFIGQTFNITDALIKCIKEYKPITIMKAGDYGVISDNIDRNKYPVLIASDNELRMTNKLRDETGKPDLLYVHYMDERLKDTHGHWIEDGYKMHSMCLAADVYSFTGGEHKDVFASDISFIGGRWGYKARTIDKWILPLTKKNWNVKIFGNQSWGIPEFCGFAPSGMEKDIFSSAKVCPNVHEPHSQDFGYDVIERPFKLLANKCIVVSDYVEDLPKMLPHVICCKNPEEYSEKIEEVIVNPEKFNDIKEAGYEHVINNHTYFHRMAKTFDAVGLDGQEILDKYEEIKEKL